MNKIPDLLRAVLAWPNETALGMAYESLSAYGEVAHGERYCYLPGTVPLCLVAHVDTVHRRPPEQLYYDQTARILWSPQGLGADDRAGVYAILSLLAEGWRPHVLLTDLEETGGQGAQEAALDLADEMDRADVRCLIQLDRQGARDAATYSCDSPRMERYLRPHGYRAVNGTFSDISILMPDWGIAGANLSIGYYGQHSTAERLNLGEMDYTISAVRRMCKAPPRKRIEYRSHWQGNGKTVIQGWKGALLLTDNPLEEDRELTDEEQEREEAEQAWRRFEREGW